MPTLKVPGATLYYEQHGTGPLLVAIPGGPSDAGAFASLSAALADRYTVVAYDPRGNSRSVLDGAPDDQDLAVHGDDAARLIEAIDAGPANVLGSSGGAQIGLALAARHPARVRLLVAHEPPCVSLLADGDVLLREFERIHELHRASGVPAAMAAFARLAGFDQQPPPSNLPPDAAATMARMTGNIAYFVEHGMRAIAGFRPDVATLRAVRVVVGVGADSAGQLAHRCARALAAKLEVDPVTFPGGHTGFLSHTAEFARALDATVRS
jgi:pimeloyl-ACP methyl ester carboxylesterase